MPAFTVIVERRLDMATGTGSPGRLDGETEQGEDERTQLSLDTQILPATTGQACWHAVTWSG